MAAGSFAGGAVVATGEESPDRRAAARFVALWSRGDHTAMHALLAASERRRIAPAAFAAAYEQAAATATLERIVPAGELRALDERAFEVPLVARTRLFGDIRGRLRLRLAGAEDRPGIVWRPEMTFPGVRAGESLRRETRMPPRASLEARDGTVIAQGPQRTSDLGPASAHIAGAVGPIPREERDDYVARGYPEDALVGLTGLERHFEARLAGRFGGTLRAGSRVIARADPQPAGPVRTSIDARVETAAVEALAGRLGGVAVVRPRTGEVLGLAGLAYSALQPPGSVFKIVTLAGALDAGVVKPSDRFAVQTAATLEGVELQNAHGEACGGTLRQSFAHSCNSVFAPMGADLGARRLVAAAERFGFNEETVIAGAARATIPPADEVGDDLAVGSSAIGQGLVTATPLRMALVAGAIANDGVLVRPTLLRGGQGRRSRAATRRTADAVTRMMRAVVTDGTGVAAAIPGVPVAGKTGTAELRSTVPDDTAPPGTQPAPEDTTDTTAWFVAFAPANRPRVAVAVMLVGEGAGGDTAAPAARVVLEAALGR